MHNETTDLRCCLRFDLRSTVYAPELQSLPRSAPLLTQTFFSPTSDPLGIEQRFCHRVSLCETDRMIPNLILKRSRSRFDLSSGKLKVNYVAYHFIRDDETNILVLFSFVYHAWFKSYRQKLLSYRPIMGVVKNWPDLRSRKWENSIFDVGAEVMFRFWPDLVTWPWNLESQNWQTRCVIEF